MPFSISGQNGRRIDAARFWPAILFTIATAGCATMTVAPVQEFASAPDETLEVLAGQLALDSWTLNLNWSPRSEWESQSNGIPTPGSLRWNHRGPSAAAERVEPTPQADATDKADQTEPGPPGQDSAKIAEVPAGSQESSWDGFWPLSPVDVLEQRTNQPNGNGHDLSGEQQTTRYFAALMERNDLAGWNAAIVWAQRDPKSAHQAAKVLERLVAQTPETLKDQRAEESEHDSRPAAEQAKRVPWELPWDLRKPWEREQPSAVLAEPIQEAVVTSAPDMSPQMQSAAAEAWCLVLSHLDGDAIDHFAPAGRILQRVDLPDEIRGELFRGVARRMPPGSIPRLANALRRVEERDSEGSGSGTSQRAPVSIRRAAIEACLIHALWRRGSPSPIEDNTDRPFKSIAYDESLWPAGVSDCRWDPDPYVRRVYGEWLTAAQHPQAFAILKSQFQDTDTRVREGAYASIGLLGGDTCREEMRRQAARPEERVRALAVKSLANWGAGEVAKFVDDPSFTVRNVLAEELANRPTLEAALLLQVLLTDASPQVQSTAAGRIYSWPDELAIPLLLHCLRESTWKARDEALAQLRRRIGVPFDFPLDAGRRERDDALLQLVREHELPGMLVENLRRDGLRSVHTVDHVQVGEIRADLEEIVLREPDSQEFALALHRLNSLEAADVPLIEDFLQDHPGVSLELVYAEILPRLSPAYAGLRELVRGDIATRRHGARTLAQLGDSASLSRGVVLRLRELLANEQDQLVWRYAMKAVGKDATDEAAEIALLAINHTWPDIRILGCEYVGRHGHPAHALWLLPLLQDENFSVQLAAVRGAGECHNPLVIEGFAGDDGSTALPGLRALMSHSNRDLAFAAVTSMTKLGDRQAASELVRQSYQDSSEMRREVIGTMGKTGQNRFVEHLIRMAWTEPADHVKREILSSLDRLVPPDDRPPGLAEYVGIDDKIGLWVAWWEKRSSTPMAKDDSDDRHRRPSDADAWPIQAITDQSQ